ncbi:TetR family transcriptional regulator [Streptomyces malaysiensis subsp. malaysiensis]
MDRIARAADVSSSTVFRYFPAKEDIVLTDEYDALMAEAIRERPRDEPPAASLRHAVAELLGPSAGAEREELLARLALVRQVPALRARMSGCLADSGALLGEALAERSGRAPDDFEVRVAVGAVLGALREAVFHCLDHGLACGLDGSLGDGLDESLGDGLGESLGDGLDESLGDGPKGTAGTKEPRTPRTPGTPGRPSGAPGPPGEAPTTWRRPSTEPWTCSAEAYRCDLPGERPCLCALPSAPGLTRGPTGAGPGVGRGSTGADPGVVGARLGLARGVVGTRPG